MLAMERSDFEVDEERVRKGRGDARAVVGLVLIPERDRASGCGGGLCVVRSCAADTDGLNFLGVSDPFMSAVISSPLADGPADAKFEPFEDLLSVDDVPWLPLLLRLRYFSMASASLSRMRFTIGDSADVGGD